MDDGPATPSEAGVDVIFDVAESFAAKVLAADVSNESYAEHKDAYVHVFIGGYPADGFTDDYALARAAEIGEEIAAMGWFVAKAELVVADDSMARDIAIEDGDADEDEEPQTMLFIDLFPNEGRPCDNAAHLPFFWHASPAQNREGILANGIEPRFCGNDHIVLPRARIYACVHAMFLDRVQLDMSRSRRWTGLDLWRIDLSAIPGHAWREDVEMDGISSWTDHTIPPEALTLCGTLENMHGDGWRRLTQPPTASRQAT